MAPEGQAHWEEYSEQGLITVAVMLETNSGATPGQEDAARWAETYGLTHPVLADSTGDNYNYITTGYPTFVVIDQTMTIVNADLWPFDIGYVTDLLDAADQGEDSGSSGF